MTGMDKDPFERLSQIATPEPDPAKIDAVAAMSARAFSAELARAPESRKGGGGFAGWIRSTNWLMPASAMAFAALAAVVVVPLMGRPDLLPSMQEPAPAPASVPSETALSREPAAVADAEAELEAQAGPAPEGPVRMGAAPAPGSQNLPLDLRDDAVTQSFSFGDTEIMVRSVDDDVALYLMDGMIERQFDRRVKEPSETIIVTDAFRQDSGLSDVPVLLVQSGPEGGRQQWDAFVDSGAGYVLSGALSLEIHDATDRDEVVARLKDVERR